MKDSYENLSDTERLELLSHSKKMIEIPAGTFIMGALEAEKTPHEQSSHQSLSRYHARSVFLGGSGYAGHPEQPRHKVTFTRALFMGVFPCTQVLYHHVTGLNPSTFKGLTRPVECVSWYDAILFCNKLSELEGLEPCYELPQPFGHNNKHSRNVKWNRFTSGYRLPTEAEWEYCARGGTEHPYAGNKEPDEVAWYDKNSHLETHCVGEKNANGFGLHDMSGHVYEWVFDSWDEAVYLRGDYCTDPSSGYSRPNRVSRGGSWDSTFQKTRVSHRRQTNASTSYQNLGFRLCRTST